MKLDLNQKKDVERFRAFTKYSPYANQFQTLEWAGVKNNWNHDAFYLEKEGEIDAAIVVLSIEEYHTKKPFFYAPRGPVCDLHDIDRFEELIGEVAAYAKSKGAFLLRMDPLVIDDPELVELYRSRGYTFETDPALATQPAANTTLAIGGRSADEVLADYSKSTRKSIRFAYRQGFEIEIGTREDIESFYALDVLMCEKKGIGYRNKEYLYRLWDAFPENTRLSFVLDEGKRICCSWLIDWNGRGFAILGADPIFVSKNQSYFLNFEEVKYCIEKGLSYYDLGGVFSEDMNDGLFYFKQKFSDGYVERWIGALDIVFAPDAYALYREKNQEAYAKRHGA